MWYLLWNEACNLRECPASDEFCWEIMGEHYRIQRMGINFGMELISDGRHLGSQEICQKIFGSPYESAMWDVLWNEVCKRWKYVWLREDLAGNQMETCTNQRCVKYL